MQTALRELAPDEVHVWSFEIGGPQPADFYADATRIVSRAERARANAFIFDRDRCRYLRSHVYMRGLLAGYLGIASDAVPIRIGEQDKPHLDTSEPFGFNLSHSADAGLIAVGRNRYIGVDVEMFGARYNLASLARMVYTAAEQRELASLDPQQFERGFLTLWARKEAILKAMGVGLSLAPADLHVGLESRDAVARIDVPKGPWGDTIDVMDLPLGSDRVGALAAAGGWRSMELFGAPMQEEVSESSNASSIPRRVANGVM